MIKTLFVAASLFVVGSAYAEETTVIRRETTPGIGVTVTPPVSVEHRSTVTTTTGCDTKIIHKENDMGDSKTIKKTEC